MRRYANDYYVLNRKNIRFDSVNIDLRLWFKLDIVLQTFIRIFGWPIMKLFLKYF